MQAVVLASSSLCETDATPLLPKFAVVNAAVGDNAIVAAVTGKKIRVLSGLLVAGAIGTVRFESAAGGTALTGIMVCVASNVLPFPFNPLGHFETVAGQALSLETTADVDGWVTYVEV